MGWQMTLTIQTWMSENYTIGRLNYGEFQCWTLELPWRDNRRNVSCVPVGTYNARKYDSPKHGNVILLDDVPERTWIEIHAAKYVSQLLGCIAVGESFKFIDGDEIPDLDNSPATLNKLLSLLPEYFPVEITRV